MERIDSDLVRDLDWSDVPLGHVLNSHIPPSPEEEAAFRDWICPVNAPPGWKRVSFWRLTTEDDGRKVLEHWAKEDAALVTGASDWRDAAIEASVCPLSGSSAPHADDEYAIVGRSGVLVRMETSRHYVFFCIEGHRRAVLYRREDGRYTELAATERAFDPETFYRLRLEARGNRFRAYIDGERVADVFDPVLRRGYVGIRTNTLARFERIRATMSAGAVQWVVRSREAEEAYLEPIRARYPKPVLVHEIDLSRHGGGAILAIGRFGSGAANDFLVQQPWKDGVALAAITFENELLWRAPQKTEIHDVKTHDMDGSGVERIVGRDGSDLVVIDGADGRELARRPYPTMGVFQWPSAESRPAAVEHHYIAHLRPTAHASDIVVKEGDPGGGHTLWAYDDGLNLLWETTVDQPRHGHHIHFVDFDDDGREEICAGYHLIGPDGEIRWRIEGGRSLDVFSFGRHADSCAGGDFDGDGRGEIAIVGGSEGFLLCDAETGELIAKHDVGHAQGLAVASFRPDLAGLEIHVGTRWGNYGIRTFFSALGERLLTFQPDFLGQQGEPVNWRGDGEELLLIRTSPEAYGLWNAFGQKVVPLDRREVPPPTFIADVWGDPRDEFIVQRRTRVTVYSQDGPPPDPTRIYAPIRHKRHGHPVVSYPAWAVENG